MQLLGEEVNTQVAMLTSGGRGGDSDDLTWATLEDQEITDSDVMARNGDSVRGVGCIRGRGASWSWFTSYC